MSSILNPIPIPISDPISTVARPEYRERGKKDPREGMVTQPWVDWFTDQSQQLSETSNVVAMVTLIEQTAAVSGVDMTNGLLPSGLYRLNYFMRVAVTGFGGGFTAELEFDWTDTGNPMDRLGLAIITDSTDQNVSEVFMIHTDALSPIRYTLLLTGALPPASLNIYIVLERVA